MSSARYSPSFRFSDPIFQSTGVDSYRQNLRLLRTVFDINFTIHAVNTIPTEGTDHHKVNLYVLLSLYPCKHPPFPVQPHVANGPHAGGLSVLASRRSPLGQKLTFTGTSTYNVSLGLLVSQKDVWDAVGNNEFPQRAFWTCLRCLCACMQTVRLKDGG